MTKKYFYEFTGRIKLTADSKEQAEEMVMGIDDATEFIVAEELIEIDSDHIPLDQKLRKQKLGTVIHPSDVDKFQNFKLNKLRYSEIFDEFMHGKYSKEELMDKMDQADQRDIKDDGFDYVVSMVDLKSKEAKTAKLAVVD